MPLPVNRIPPELCSSLEYVFTDIDDTLTTEGLLPAVSYTALWNLYEAGLKVIPVTGRPAGWCDHIARMWPVEAVLGENGAFFYSYNRKTRKMHREYFESADARAQSRARLQKIRDEILLEVPGSAVAADQDYRIADLAIDFCEDVEPLPLDAVEKIQHIAERNNAVSKVSSIHVNIWFGTYDKVSCLKDYLFRECGRTLSDLSNRIIFIGDSPNDEPIFREVPESVGVANIAKFLPSLSFPPRYVSEASGGQGFAEVADILLSRRNRK